jgi:hypothetical protein
LALITWWHWMIFRYWSVTNWESHPFVRQARFR